MNLEFFTISMLNGISYGLLLFMLSSGLTLIFSMMGVLNFAHTSFYMVGAYLAYSMSQAVGFWPAFVVAPLVVGVMGALFERYALRKVHKFGHVPELLVTFGLSYVVLEVVKLVWGLSNVPFSPPEVLQGSAFTVMQSSESGLGFMLGAAPKELCASTDAVKVACSTFPAARFFIMAVAVVMLVFLWLLLTRTRIGLVIQAALTHPEMVEALGHNVPRVLMLVFGSGCALAGLAGVIGGMTFITEKEGLKNDQFRAGVNAQVKTDGERMVGQPLELMAIDQQADEMTPYERLIGDAIQGDQGLFARQDVVEEGWRIVEKILGNSVPVHPYKPGTWGPEAVNDVLLPSGGWHAPKV
jgi:branched-chain amino acid transport system permease protein